MTKNYIGGGGFYVDIGAHHPFRFSNTFKLYQKGWSGINIDAMPKSMKLFNRFRKRDTNLEIGVGNKSSIINFYIFEEHALNTFDEEIAKQRQLKHPIKEIQKIPVENINTILKQYLNHAQKIDLLSIDVEGMDLDILKSLDWALFYPEVVLAESYKKDLHTDPIYLFMQSQNYKMLAKTTRTYIFIKEDSILLS
ncbi:FkbM family methyltransferase [Helicobacter anseris]|uniref:FkbM family methyltransferase n=1 Tax=Helicobacter anseris TaxID=375926 RepID=UPI001FECC907|nr:FkbM family methyltransferase [Helicobacter anseris]